MHQNSRVGNTIQINLATGTQNTHNCTSYTVYLLMRFVNSQKLWENWCHIILHLRHLVLFSVKMSLELTNNYITAFSTVLLMYTTIQKFEVSSFFYLLFCKGALNWSKMTAKTSNITKYLYSKEMLFFSTSIHQIIQKKMCHGSIKILQSTAVFNTENKKKFLSNKTTYKSNFWRIMWDWRLGCWKFSFAITGINDIFKYIQILNIYFKL